MTPIIVTVSRGQGKTRVTLDGDFKAYGKFGAAVTLSFAVLVEVGAIQALMRGGTPGWPLWAAGLTAALAGVGYGSYHWMQSFFGGRRSAQLQRAFEDLIRAVESGQP